jgi:hypothetical protein
MFLVSWFPFLGHNFQPAGKCRDVILGVLQNQRSSTQSGVGRYRSGERYAGRLVRKGNRLKRANRDIRRTGKAGSHTGVQALARDDNCGRAVLMHDITGRERMAPVRSHRRRVRRWTGSGANHGNVHTRHSLARRNRNNRGRINLPSSCAASAPSTRVAAGIATPASAAAGGPHGYRKQDWQS